MSPPKTNAKCLSCGCAYWDREDGIDSVLCDRRRNEATEAMFEEVLP